MACIPFADRQTGRVTGYVCVPEVYKLRYTTHRGNVRVVEFEWHNFLGPVFTRKDGEPWICQPGEHHPVWDAFERWDTNKRPIDRDGFAVLCEQALRVKEISASTGEKTNAERH